MSRTCGSIPEQHLRLFAPHVRRVAEPGADERPSERHARVDLQPRWSPSHAPATVARARTPHPSSDSRPRPRAPRQLPGSGSPATTAMLTVHAGMPYRKFTVPSIGSTTQLTPLVPVRESCSSPRMPSSGRAARMRSRMSASVSRSVAVTMSVGVDLVAATSTPVPPARCAARANSPASTAMLLARSSRAARVDGCLVLGHPLTLRPAPRRHRPTRRTARALRLR